jgi:glutaredoxin
LPKFEGSNVQVLGISVDHVPCLTAWADSLDGITYPLLSDFWPHGKVSELYGVLRPEGYSERAIFIIDPQGIIRYIDIHDIGTQPDNDVLLTELAGITGDIKLLPYKATEEDLMNLPRGGVVMYCTAWCPDCKMARKWLKEKNIAYTEVNITHTPGAGEQVRRWAGGNVITPTFNINGEIIVDFDLPKLKQILGVSE